MGNKRNLLVCAIFILTNQSNALNIQVLSSYPNFVQTFIPCIFDYADVIYFQDESSHWYQMEADFTNLELMNNTFTQTCNSESSLNSEYHVVCVEKSNSNISIFDPTNNFNLITSVPLNDEYKNWEVLFYEDFIILNNEGKNGEGFVIFNALNGEELYSVPKIDAVSVEICPGNNAFYFATQAVKTQFVTYFPQNKSQVVALTLPVHMDVMFLEPMNQSTVFMTCTSNTVMALVGLNMNKGIAGIPTVIQEMNFNTKLNDTHMIVQHGPRANYVSLYYVSQNLSIIEALRLDLTNQLPDGLNLDVQMIQGTSAILIVGTNQEESQGVYSLIVNATNMEMIEYQFGAGDIYPAEIELQNGSYVYLSSIINGYFIGDGINFPTFIKNGQKGYYTSPMQPNQVWAFTINPTKSTGNCTLTNFESSGINVYQYEECPCLTGQLSEYSLTSIVGRPGQDGFMFAYVCGAIYVYNQEKFLGNFNPIDLNWEHQLPLTLLNETSINVVNVEWQNGAQLYTYNFNRSEPYIKRISPPAQYPSIFGSKISEDIFLYSYPHESQTVISVYQISQDNIIQNITVNKTSPFGVYPFQVNLEASQPVEVAILKYGDGTTYKVAAITSQGEVTEMENGEFLQLLSENTIVMNNNAGSVIDLVVYEVNSNQEVERRETFKEIHNFLDKIHKQSLNF